MKNLLDHLLLALAVVFLIVGIDQFIKGFNAYWAFMISTMGLIWLNLRKFKKNNLNLNQENTAQSKPKSIKNQAVTKKK
jgi:hypothetical protein